MQNVPRPMTKSSSPIADNGETMTSELGPHSQDWTLIADDLRLLATGHHLIGTFGSSFTLLAQELIAINRLHFAPRVTYCHNNECMRSLPLVDPHFVWHFS